MSIGEDSIAKGRPVEVRNERWIPRSQHSSMRSAEMDTPALLTTISLTWKSGSSTCSGFARAATPSAPAGFRGRNGTDGVFTPADVTTCKPGRAGRSSERKSCGPPSTSSSRGRGPRTTSRSLVLPSITPNPVTTTLFMQNLLEILQGD